MPVSDFHCISDVLHVVEAVMPKCMLDVGVGFGKWGVLCREVLDVYYQRLDRGSWSTRIEGVEIFEPYRNPIWSFAYDQVHVCDVEALLDKEGENFDLILCCDLIEHFEKDTGRRVLDKMLQRARVVIIVTPLGHFPQDAMYGNAHEEHKSEWAQEDFVNIPHLYKVIGTTFLCVLARDQADLRAVKLRHPFEVLGAKKGAVELARFAVGRVRARFR